MDGQTHRLHLRVNPTGERRPHAGRQPRPPPQRHRRGDGQGPARRVLAEETMAAMAKRYRGGKEQLARDIQPDLRHGEDLSAPRTRSAPSRTWAWSWWSPTRPTSRRPCAWTWPSPTGARTAAPTATTTGGAEGGGAGHGGLAEGPRRLLRGRHPPRGLHGRRAHPARRPPRSGGLRRGAGPGDGAQHQRAPPGRRRSTRGACARPGWTTSRSRWSRRTRASTTP